MKKFKFYFPLILILVGVIVVGILSRLYWLNDIKQHPTYYEFIASIIIAGVTSIYVWLTYGILEAQNTQLSIMRKYVIVPNIIRINVEPSIEMRCTIQNASVNPASDITAYALLKMANTKEEKVNYYLGFKYLPVINPHETVKINFSENIGTLFLLDDFTNDSCTKLIEEDTIKFYLLGKISNKVCGLYDLFVDPVHAFIVIKYMTLYGEEKIIVREFSTIGYAYPITQDFIIGEKIQFLT